MKTLNAIAYILEFEQWAFVHKQRIAWEDILCISLSFLQEVISGFGGMAIVWKVKFVSYIFPCCQRSVQIIRYTFWVRISGHNTIWITFYLYQGNIVKFIYKINIFLSGTSAHKCVIQDLG